MCKYFRVPASPLLSLTIHVPVESYVDPESLVVFFFFFFFVILVAEGREDPNTTKRGLLSADNGSTLNAGLVALRFSQESYSFVFLQGVPDLLPPHPPFLISAWKCMFRSNKTHLVPLCSCTRTFISENQNHKNYYSERWARANKIITSGFMAKFLQSIQKYLFPCSVKIKCPPPPNTFFLDLFHCFPNTILFPKTLEVPYITCGKKLKSSIIPRYELFNFI